MGATADYRLEEVIARQQIHDALMYYCRGVDRLDRDMLLAAYHPGALHDHGVFQGSCEEFADYVFKRHIGNIPTSTHFMGNVLIKFVGDVAHCESYALGFQQLQIDGTPRNMIGGVRYVDRFEKRDGCWRIAERRVVLDWSRFEAVEAMPASPASGKRSPEDPSYRDLKDWISHSAPAS